MRLILGLLAALAVALAPCAALAQSTAAPVVTGYLTHQESIRQTTCFVQYGATELEASYLGGRFSRRWGLRLRARSIGALRRAPSLTSARALSGGQHCQRPSRDAEHDAWDTATGWGLCHHVARSTHHRSRLMWPRSRRGNRSYGPKRGPPHGGRVPAQSHRRDDQSLHQRAGARAAQRRRGR